MNNFRKKEEEEWKILILERCIVWNNETNIDFEISIYILIKSSISLFWDTSPFLKTKFFVLLQKS